MMAALRWPLGLPVLLYQSIALALSQVWANKVRGMLTTLGILIGVAAVSAVIALIAGMQERVLKEFEAFGTNKIFIMPKWRQVDRGAWSKVVFKNDLFEEFLERCPSIRTFSRDAGYGGIPAGYNGLVPEKAPQISGVDPAFHDIERIGALFGRPMSELDSQQLRRVCLINTKLRDELKMNRDPTGETIEVAYFGRFLVVGVLEDAPTMGPNPEGHIVTPFTFTTYRYNFPTYYGVIAMAKSREQMDEAQAEVDFYMRQKRHLKPGEEASFNIYAPEREIKQINDMADMLKTVAGGIVAISLLVGGVGIMNIMLVSVSERTREIGLRKAVGARPSAICLQFLVEAVMLCLLGGALGLVAGQGITSFVASYLPDDPNRWMYFDPIDNPEMPDAATKGLSIILPMQAIVIAFVFSAGVGLIFGFFPAIKAALLDPIEALRHE